MNKFFLTCFLLVGYIAVAQTKNVQIPVYRQKDTTLWYKWTQENIQKIGLQDLTNSAMPFHFRFWTEIQVVEIWTMDNKTAEGRFINYTSAYNPVTDKTDKPEPEKFFSKTDTLDSIIARQILEFANKQQLFQVPSQDSIKGWSNGMDGDTYLIEYSTPLQYSFKSYWTPSIQKDIKEATIIDAFYKYIQVLLIMNKKWAAFIHNLPDGCYHAGSYFVTCNNIKSKKKL